MYGYMRKYLLPILMLVISIQAFFLIQKPNTIFEYRIHELQVSADSLLRENEKLNLQILEYDKKIAQSDKKLKGKDIEINKIKKDTEKNIAALDTANSYDLTKALINRYERDSLSTLQTDTAQTCLPTHVIRLAAKDLIEKDGCKEEVIILIEKIEIYQSREEIHLKNSSLLKSKITNLEDVVKLKDQQLVDYNKELKKANRELQLAHLRLKIYNGIVLIVAGSVVILTL
jgi:chromosome segregation ATPase